MRKTIVAGMATAALSGALLAGTGSAQADVGDGSWNCNFTEICFRKDRGSDNSIKHFWNGANHSAVSGKHGDYQWGGPVPGGNVRDTATEFWNRDSQCPVFVWDIDGGGDWFAYAHQPQGATTWFFDLRNRNNGHTRCQNYSAPKGL